MKKTKTTEKMFFYNSIAAEFDSVVNMYDTRKRLNVVFSEMLPFSLKGKKLLDAGCGTGWFSAEAKKRGASVTALDLGKELLREVAKKTKVKTTVGSVLDLPFADESFDVVLSNEVIEHVTDPAKAIKEMARVLAPGGVLVLTTPNQVWHWSVEIANRLHLRPYQGLENWQSWDSLVTELSRQSLEIVHKRGIHALPFNFSFMPPVLDVLDAAHPVLRPWMINMAVTAIKRR